MVRCLKNSPVKLRLWEAGRMAGMIARGDYRARVEAGRGPN